ncbi:MAG: hypothetical protein KDC18_08845 [Alphaproteobacteria bacterium]|nr:hypothetical protein [Alphaproteobacteria bacterium]MCB9931212.1 hypothetical protein [Alphaproteobacteria bacterium]
MQVSVSPEGAIYAPGTEAFFERIGYSNPDFDAGDYVVRNLGFVSIARRSTERMMVRMRPSLVSSAALDSALRVLVGQNFSHGEIQHYDREWTSEVWPNDPAMLHRLVELCEKSGEAYEPRFGAKPLQLESMADTDDNPLRPLFQKWRISASVFDDTTMPFLINYGLDYRLIVMTADGVSDPLRFQFMGEGFKFYDARQKANIIGAPINRQPDVDYGQWLLGQYSKVVKTGMPSLDYVTACIRSDSGPGRRSRYERLLLPWRTADNKLLVTCASILISSEAEGATSGDLPPKAEASGDLPSDGEPLGDESLDIAEKLTSRHTH